MWFVQVKNMHKRVCDTERSILKKYSICDMRPSLLAMLVVPGVIGLFALSGCDHRKSTQAPRALVEARSPFQASPASKSDLRALRKVVIAPIFVTPAAPAALPHVANLEGKLEQIALGKLRIESMAGIEVKKRTHRMYGGRRLNHEDRQKLMSQFAADSLLETVVLRYRERQGSKLGSESPAEVGVQFRLFGAEREPIWQASYHFKDRALSEDILSVQNRFSGDSGAGWKSASNLIEDSISQAISNLELQRANSFLE